MERKSDSNIYFRIPLGRKQLIVYSVIGLVFFAAAFSGSKLTLHPHSIMLSSPLSLIAFLVCMGGIVYEIKYAGRKLAAITLSGDVLLGGKGAVKLELNTFEVERIHDGCIYCMRFAKSNIKNKYIVSSKAEKKEARNRPYTNDKKKFFTNYFVPTTKSIICIEFKNPLSPKKLEDDHEKIFLEKIYISIENPQKFFSYLG